MLYDNAMHNTNEHGHQGASWSLCRLALQLTIEATYIDEVLLLCLVLVLDVIYQVMNILLQFSTHSALSKFPVPEEMVKEFEVF